MKFKLTCIVTGVFVSFAANANNIAWDEKLYNPMPLEDDVVLPMPCDGAMVFRKVNIAKNNILDDKQIVLGQESADLGYVEQPRPSYISGGFNEKSQGYYLIAKYELTQLQYNAVMAEKCPKPSNKLRLPATGNSWFQAMDFADKYNLWLRQNHLSDIPSEDGVAGYVRLPTEEEWEFAARGGSAVDASEFRDIHYPMPDGVNNYEWFAGSQSSNGKLQLVGLLKPNPLGIHDILGNVNEMMLEPFRVNKLNRLHGQAGGVVVRGGNYLTKQAEIKTATRIEQHLYKDSGPNVSKTTGMRLVMVSPVLTSLNRVQDISKFWQELGQGNEHEGSAQLVQSLQSISTGVEDEKLKKQLKDLEGELRSSNEKHAQARDQAILASINLGAFLCTKLYDDGHTMKRLNASISNTCQIEGMEDICEEGRVRVEEHETALGGIKRYYASSMIDSALLYGEKLIEQQIPKMYQNIDNQKNLKDLKPFVRAYWNQQKLYLKNQKIDTDSWLQQCMDAK